MFTKVVRVGTCTVWNGRATIQAGIFCEILFNDGRLSITGVIGPRADGNAWGSCGQINGTIREDLKSGTLTLGAGWTVEMVSKFLDVWDKWHLNDMQAGTPAQTAELARHTFPGYPVSHYDWAVEVLTKAGLNPDGGYRYGTKWLRVEVPADVLEFLKSLPNTNETPAWV